jgi:purine-binding chemotaxis protein CheW
MTAETAGSDATTDLLVAIFLLGESAYGVDTAIVQEVVPTGEITPVRGAPPYVAGIRNLRGRIVTVVDLKKRLGIEEGSPGTGRRILIVDWHGEPVGLLVDTVTDTIEVPVESLESAPPNTSHGQNLHVRGVCRASDRFVVLLDPETLLEPDENHSSTQLAET